MNNSPIKSVRILMVEDEEILAEGIRFNLVKNGYAVEWVKDGRAALKAFNSMEYDLILLDIMIPYIDGFEVARQIRMTAPLMPILMLTARTAVDDRVHGLEVGADDYLTKPFHLEELLARIKAMLRRHDWYRKTPPVSNIYRIGKIQVNFDDFVCRSENRQFVLTQREAILLKYLVAHKNRIVSRPELLENVWNIYGAVETRTVDIFIARLRKYFEPNPKKPIYIKSVRSAGYLFNDAAE
ncbi:MAG: response regulator transcription factor [Candidatus Marinimicrobia bacterium]|nr:response regulator transcription factor [Candidatus Neomarinimicrobiota bacterium]